MSLPTAMVFPPPPAAYRSKPELSRGRFVAEPASATRTVFQRDRDRIVHAAAFRRLALKTQVFLPEEGDHYRTRLTHTIEVAQIARTLTRALGLDDDLAEALALAHDLGHAPFAHTGEEALAAAMQAFGGFDHNAQSVRVVMLIERRYPSFTGLNLSWETLEGLLKRSSSRPFQDSATGGWFRSGLPCLEDDWGAELFAAPQPSAEAQAAAVADDIAYNAHDLEDGLQAGLFALTDLDDVPLLAETRDALGLATPGLAPDLVVRGLARELVGHFVEGAIGESRRRLADAEPADADAIRMHPRPLVALPAELSAASDAIKAFLFRRMYRHPRLAVMRAEAKQIVGDLASRLCEDPDRLPATWRSIATDPQSHARRVTDYVASMTDRFAIAEHARHFDARPDLG